MGKKKEEDCGAALQRAYERWDHLREHGGSDPFWQDGYNMNLVRNHIIYYKGKLEEQGDSYPECYYWELPPETDRNYMADSGAIKDLAKEALASYLESADLAYLCQSVEAMGKMEKSQTSIENVIGYARGLASAIRENDLITMRRHARGRENYLATFVECAAKTRQIKENYKQGAGGKSSLYSDMAQKNR